MFFFQGVSAAEVRDCGYGEEACEGHHAGYRRRSQRCGHDTDSTCGCGHQRERGHASHQLIRLLYSPGLTQTHSCNSLFCGSVTHTHLIFKNIITLPQHKTLRSLLPTALLYPGSCSCSNGSHVFLRAK